jgi:hypothetical protein
VAMRRTVGSTFDLTRGRRNQAYMGNVDTCPGKVGWDVP